MLALYRCGRQADALRSYERTRTYLVDELGIDPSFDVRDLELRILEQDPALDFWPALSIGGNLPARLSAFVGRADETVHVEKLISEHRPVTLAGLGGIGKTALAVEVARRVERNWAGGVWMVKLAPIADRFVNDRLEEAAGHVKTTDHAIDAVDTGHLPGVNQDVDDSGMARCGEASPRRRRDHAAGTAPGRLARAGSGHSSPGRSQWCALSRTAVETPL